MFGSMSSESIGIRIISFVVASSLIWSMIPVSQAFANDVAYGYSDKSLQALTLSTQSDDDSSSTDVSTSRVTSATSARYLINSQIKTVTMGNSHAALVLNDGSMVAWGSNFYHQIIKGTSGNYAFDSSGLNAPAVVERNVKAVSAGPNFTTAFIKSDSSLWICGKATSQYNGKAPWKFLDNIESVSLGDDYAAAIKTDGSLISIGSFNADDCPTILTDASFVECGYKATVAIRKDGSLWCWQNSYLDSDFPKEPTKICDNVICASTKYDNVVYVTSDGTLWGFGRNWHGELTEDHEGDGTYDSPAKIMTGVVQAAAGFDCCAAVKSDGSLWTWGYQRGGRLGNGVSKETNSLPVKILDRVQSVTLGGYWDNYQPHASYWDEISYGAAIRDDGSLWTWGDSSANVIGHPNNLIPEIFIKRNDSVEQVTKIPGKVKTHYGVNEYANTAAGDVYDNAQQFIAAMNNYLYVVQSVTEKDSARIANSNGTKNSAQLLRKADDASDQKMITMQSDVPDAAMNSIYGALAQYFDEYIDEAVSLGKINMSASTIEISASIVNKVRNNLHNDYFSRTINNYTVEFNVTRFLTAYTGSVRVIGNGRYYTGILVSSPKDTAKALTTYVNTLCDWEKDALYEVVRSIFVGLSEVTGIADFTKSEMKSLLKNKTDVLRNRGYGDLLTYWQGVRDGYDLVKSIAAASTSDDLAKSLKNANSIYSKLEKLDYSDAAVTDKTVNAAMSKLATAKNKLERALFDYIYDQDSQGNNGSWWDHPWESFKTLFVQCPVDFSIYDTSGKLLGSVSDTIVDCSDDIAIRVDGDVKQVIIPSGLDVRIDFTGTDAGTMTYVVEQTVDGEVTGRANYYYIDLVDGCTYTQNLSKEELTSKNASKLIASNGGSSYSTYIAVDNTNANVQVECKVEGDGIVTGAGPYAEGSPVTLTAYPSSEDVIFDGWYENNKLVCTTSDYRFAAVSNTSIVAKFSKNKVIDDSYSVYIADKYSDLIDVFIYKADNDLHDVVISSAGIDDLDELQLKFKNYSADGNLLGEASLPTVKDGAYRFTAAAYDFNSSTRTEIYSADGSLLANIRLGKDVPVSSLKANAGKTTLNVGESTTVTTTVLPSDASNKSVTYASSDSSVLSVSASGKVTAKKAGAANVTVTSSDNAKATQTISFKVVASASSKTSISKATISNLKAKTFTGKKLTQKPTVKLNGKTLKSGTDYTISYKNNIKAGTATIIATGKGNYTGTKSATFKINKAKQPLTAKAVNKTAKVKTLKKKAVTLTKTVTVKKKQGTLTYKNVSTQKAAKKFKVNAKKGTITVPKGTKKGTYKVKVKVTAKGNANYKSGSKTVIVKVVVK